jgi:hypothetical protein
MPDDMKLVPAAKEGGTEDEEIDLGPFLSYLQSEKGHELASRVLRVVEDIKKVNLEKTAGQAKFEKWMQVSIIFLVVISTSLLTYFDKFDSATGILFGSLVGYMFGKR